MFCILVTCDPAVILTIFFWGRRSIESRTQLQKIDGQQMRGARSFFLFAAWHREAQSIGRGEHLRKSVAVDADPIRCAAEIAGLPTPTER